LTQGCPWCHGDESTRFYSKALGPQLFQDDSGVLLDHFGYDLCACHFDVRHAADLFQFLHVVLTVFRSYQEHKVAIAQDIVDSPYAGDGCDLTPDPFMILRTVFRPNQHYCQVVVSKLPAIVSKGVLQSSWIDFKIHMSVIEPWAPFRVSVRNPLVLHRGEWTRFPRPDFLTSHSRHCSKVLL